MHFWEFNIHFSILKLYFIRSYGRFFPNACNFPLNKIEIFRNWLSSLSDHSNQTFRRSVLELGHSDTLIIFQVTKITSSLLVWSNRHKKLLKSPNHQALHKRSKQKSSTNTSEINHDDTKCNKWEKARTRNSIAVIVKTF